MVVPRKHRTVSHTQCTESFYKDSVMSELQSNPTIQTEDRKNMLRILDRFEKQAIEEEQRMDMSEEELMENLQNQYHHHQQQNQQKQGQDHDKQSSAPTTTGTTATTLRRKLTQQERDALIRKAIEEEQIEERRKWSLKEHELEGVDTPAHLTEHEEEIKRMLEKEHQDLIDRFRGVDLDKESFVNIWARLSLEEQQEFQEMFMITELNKGGTSNESIGEEGDGEINNDTGQEEEQEARELLQEMGETLRRGDESLKKRDRSSNDNNNNNPAILAELDVEDLRAIRDAEISELIPIWRPWWEIEAENTGHLKKSTVPDTEEITNKEEFKRLNAGSIHATASSEPSNLSNRATNILTTSGRFLEKWVLDEEALLRPHRSLIQDASEQQDLMAVKAGLPSLIKPPHPSLIYHISALIFAYAATSRVLNGDLLEEPEQTLAYIFDLCPFYSPTSTIPTSSSLKKRASVSVQPTITSNGDSSAKSAAADAAVAPSTEAAATRLTTPQQALEVYDFETTLAVVQTSSLDSKLWKGDTLRLDMLSLLLQDLALLLTQPSRCLRSIREIKQTFDPIIQLETQIESKPKISRQHQRAVNADTGVSGARTPKMFSKSWLLRLYKKLEFYESYLLSEEWFLKTDRLDRVRAEVLMTQLRIRQEMVGWTKELESIRKMMEQQRIEIPSQVSQANRESKTLLSREHFGDLGQEIPNHASSNKPLIQELP
ncbi:hypothetical protein BX616_005286 [Lobosporangium transversale]|nr:hypothetical protein BX616_005286 [Lobosporangium transversale]